MYSPKYAKNGPAMTDSANAIAYFELGYRTTGNDAFGRSLLNMQKPFNVWTESKEQN